MSSTPEAASEATPPTPPKKKRSKLFLLIAVVLAVALGGGGFFLYSSVTAKTDEAKSEKKNHGEQADKEEADEEDGDDEEPNDALPDDEDVKSVVTLEPFVVNLADEGERRYLRLTVNVGIGEEAHEKPSPLFVSRIRNSMLAVLTTKSSEEVLSKEGKAELRKELLHAAQAASEEPHIEAVYITDFIVQL